MIYKDFKSSLDAEVLAATTQVPYMSASNIVVHRLSSVFAAPNKETKRSCDDCSLCCKTHGVLFESGTKKPAGKWCEFWNKSTRCRIYELRPSGCCNFVCEWLKGMGEDKHRPDRVKVVLDYVNHPNAPKRGILQMWEGVEGALFTPYAKEVARGALESNIITSHIYLNGSRRRVYIPLVREVTKDLLDAIEAEKFEIGSIKELS